MADSSSRIMTSSGHLVVGGGAAGKATSSSMLSGHGNWEVAGGMDQITVVRIDDTHIAEEQSHVVGKVRDDSAEFYEMEYSLPVEEEVVGEEEEDSVYVIEYSNPEEEEGSYQFTMSLDRSLPAIKPVIRHPFIRHSAKAPLPVMSRPRTAMLKHGMKQKRKLIAREEKEVKKEEIMSNKSVLELGEDYSDVIQRNSNFGNKLVCLLCPPPGKFFKRGSGLAVHLKQMHHMVEKKTFFCTYCQQKVRTQIELDAHTKRHANHEAVFTCHLCTEHKTEADNTGYKGSRMGLKSHLEKKHPGVIPHCNVCNKTFRTLMSYLADQFRHLGKSPYYCAKCQIYEMTERGLSVHIKNHNKRKKEEQEAEVAAAAAEKLSQMPEASALADNSATDDSDF